MTHIAAGLVDLLRQVFNGVSSAGNQRDAISRFGKCTTEGDLTDYCSLSALLFETHAAAAPVPEELPNPATTKIGRTADLIDI